MEPQVFKIINDIHRLLSTKTVAELSEVDVAYITGQLKTLLDLWSEPEAPEQPRKTWRNLLP